MTSPWPNPPQLHVGPRTAFPAAAKAIPLTSEKPDRPPFTLADPDLPVAVDPALAGWQPPTIDDLGLTADPVAIALNVLGQLTDEQLAAVLGYYQPPKLRAVA